MEANLPFENYVYLSACLYVKNLHTLPSELQDETKPSKGTLILFVLYKVNILLQYKTLEKLV